MNLVLMQESKSINKGSRKWIEIIKIFLQVFILPLYGACDCLNLLIFFYLGDSCLTIWPLRGFPSQ